MNINQWKTPNEIVNENDEFQETMWQKRDCERWGLKSVKIYHHMHK